MLTGELHDRLVGDDLMSEDLPLLIFLAILDFALIDGLELVRVIIDTDILMVHCLDLIIV